MATTMFFEETIKDKKDKAQFYLEFGRSNFYNGENLIYITIDEKTVILDEASGRRLCEAMAGLAGYLGYDRDE